MRGQTDTSGKASLRSAIERLPRVRLACLPTPLQDCPRLTEALGGPRILIKRDDLTGLAFGGNKTRQLEFTLGPAVEEGADVLVHGAASQSNQSRQTSAAAAKLGMKAVIVARKDARSEVVQGNLLLDYLLGAEVRITEGSRQGEVKQQVMEEFRAKGHRPYEITSHNWTLGTVAYVNCALELCDQFEEQDVWPDYVFLASGNHGVVGLTLGAKVLRAGFKPVGMRPGGGDDARIRPSLADLANEVAALLGLDVEVSEDEIESVGVYAGEGYGVVTDACLEALHLVARTEGIVLDPVYTGKAMSGLIDRIRQGEIREDQTVVFLHTGGTPGVFAYAKELVSGG